MPKFAIYYVPQAEDAFYRLGTHILGYDVRSREIVSMPPDVRAHFSEFDPAWVARSQPFGFHLTICDALECNWATIPVIERELADLLRCFDPAHQFTLQRREAKPVGIWGETGAHSLILLYQPNQYLSMLHTLIIGRINPLGTGSVFLRDYLAQPDEMPPHLAQQIRLFYSPTVLDNWYPHFTLLNPYTGENPEQVASLLTRLFEPYTLLTLRSVCLLVQMDNKTHWQIYREFLCPLPPDN